MKQIKRKRIRKRFKQLFPEISDVSNALVDHAIKKATKAGGKHWSNGADRKLARMYLAAHYLIGLTESKGDHLT